MEFDYYKAPSDHVFEEIKEKAIEIWRSYDDTYGYATKKVNRIKDLENIRDNAATIVAMFDGNNQRILFEKIKNEDTTDYLHNLFLYANSLFTTRLSKRNF